MDKKNNALVFKNRDPNNYVLQNGYFSYFMLAKYVFFFWFIVTIFIEENYDHLNGAGNKDDIGRAIISLTIAIAALTFCIPVLYLFNKQFPDPIAGIVFLLLLTDLSLIFFNYDSREINVKFEKNPYYIGLIFLLVYCFVLYFDC